MLNEKPHSFWREFREYFEFDWYSLVFGMLLMLLAISVSGFFYLKFPINSVVLGENSGDWSNVTGECGNLSTVETANCLHRYVSSIYKYNISNVRRLGMTLEELKAEGAVCRQWAQLYSSLAKEVDHNSQEVTVYFNKSTGHRFTVLYGNGERDNDYCILEQNRRPYCVVLKS
jgi:hypothetical protein